jgi:hypothetical protein
MILFDLEHTSWKGCQENGWDSLKNQYKEVIQIRYEWSCSQCSF